MDEPKFNVGPWHVGSEMDAITYMMVGDLDKPFHLPECECENCEAWRKAKGRPTHEELRAKKP